MSEIIRTFLIEPIYGDDFSTQDMEDFRSKGWPPFKYINSWKRVDTGEEKEHIAQFPAGAMWYATWMPKNWCWDNETEPHLLVKVPSGGDWDIDSRCSNCTLPNDRLHRCWVRHGTPPNITVNKAGLTCSAGAGSFYSYDKSYHGFLENGQFRRV